MTTETDVYNALVAAVAPIPVYRLHAPQENDDQPNNVPYVIFTRELFKDDQFDTFCTAVGESMSGAYIVDCFALEYAQARSMIKDIVSQFNQIGLGPDSVFEDWERTTRVYRISSSFTLWEAGALTAPSP